MNPTKIETDLVAKLEQAADHLLFLSNVSRVLSGALTDKDCFDRLLGLVIPKVADWAGLNVLTGGREIQRVNVAHTDPGKLQELRSLAKRFQPRLDDVSGPGLAIRSGKPEFLPRVTPEQLLLIFREPSEVERIERFGILSGISVPLKAHGEMIGALFLATSDSGRIFTEDDFTLAVDIGERAAYSVHNLIRYKQVNESLEKLRIEMKVRDDYFADTRHDVLTALTTAMLSIHLIEKKYGGKDELTRRTVNALQRITDVIRSSGPSVPLKEAA